MRQKLGLLLAAVLFVVMVCPAQAARPKREPAYIDLGEMIVEGKLSKPMVFYVLGRTRVRYEGLKLNKSFVDRIVVSVRTNPF